MADSGVDKRFYVIADKNIRLMYILDKPYLFVWLEIFKAMR